MATPYSLPDLYLAAAQDCNAAIIDALEKGGDIRGTVEKRKPMITSIFETRQKRKFDEVTLRPPLFLFPFTTHYLAWLKSPATSEDVFRASMLKELGDFRAVYPKEARNLGSTPVVSSAGIGSMPAPAPTRGASSGIKTRANEIPASKNVNPPIIRPTTHTIEPPPKHAASTSRLGVSPCPPASEQEDEDSQGEEESLPPAGGKRKCEIVHVGTGQIYVPQCEKCKKVNRKCTVHKNKSAPKSGKYHSCLPCARSNKGCTFEVEHPQMQDDEDGDETMDTSTTITIKIPSGKKQKQKAGDEEEEEEEGDVEEQPPVKKRKVRVPKSAPTVDDEEIGQEGDVGEQPPAKKRKVRVGKSTPVVEDKEVGPSSIPLRIGPPKCPPPVVMLKRMRHGPIVPASTAATLPAPTPGPAPPTYTPIPVPAPAENAPAVSKAPAQTTRPPPTATSSLSKPSKNSTPTPAMPSSTAVPAYRTVKLATTPAENQPANRQSSKETTPGAPLASDNRHFLSTRAPPSLVGYYDPSNRLPLTILRQNRASSSNRPRLVAATVSDSKKLAAQLVNIDNDLEHIDSRLMDLEDFTEDVQVERQKDIEFIKDMEEEWDNIFKFHRDVNTRRWEKVDTVHATMRATICKLDGESCLSTNRLNVLEKARIQFEERVTQEMKRRDGIMTHHAEVAKAYRGRVRTLEETVKQQAGSILILQQTANELWAHVDMLLGKECAPQAQDELQMDVDSDSVEFVDGDFKMDEDTTFSASEEEIFPTNCNTELTGDTAPAPTPLHENIGSDCAAIPPITERSEEFVPPRLDTGAIDVVPTSTSAIRPAVPANVVSVEDPPPPATCIELEADPTTAYFDYEMGESNARPPLSSSKEVQMLAPHLKITPPTPSSSQCAETTLTPATSEQLKEDSTIMPPPPPPASQLKALETPLVEQFETPAIPAPKPSIVPPIETPTNPAPLETPTLETQIVPLTSVVPTETPIVIPTENFNIQPIEKRGTESTAVPPPTADVAGPARLAVPTRSRTRSISKGHNRHTSVDEPRRSSRLNTAASTSPAPSLPLVSHGSPEEEVDFENTP